MALENGHQLAAQALPTPNDTPYQTPRGISRLSSRQRSPSPFSKYSPTPLPPMGDAHYPIQHESKDDDKDEKVFPHDPRRFTPDLNNSLVGQIHSLRKELDSKSVAVENLEESLHQSRVENDRLNEDLNTQTAEVRSVRQQMAVLEKTTLVALDEIANERDDALKTVADMRKRLDASKKKARSQEEDASKAHELWEKDREDWDNEKRNMERKVHVVEERIKTMVAEMMSVHSAGQNRPGVGNGMDEGMRETWFVKGTDTFSIRSNSVRATSRLSNRSLDDSREAKEASNFRASRIDGLHRLGGSKMSGLSLAEELELEEDEDNDAEEDDRDPGPNSPGALPEENLFRSRRYSEDQKARKVMGFPAERSEQSFGDEMNSQTSIGIVDDYINLPRTEFFLEYKDSATQFTPPPSPTPEPQLDEIISEKPVEQSEHAANQSRKRVAIPSMFFEQTIAAKPKAPEALRNVSVGCQTAEKFPDPHPIPTAAVTVPVSILVPSNEMISSSTQTIEDATPVSKPAGTRLSPPSIDIPVIAIHPPASRPPSSHNNVVLPPRTRNAACQVAMEMPRSLRSISVQTVQTEEIKIAKRSIQIPPRLPRSSFSTQQSSRSAGKRQQSAQRLPSNGSRRNLRSPPPIRTDDDAPPSPSLPKIEGSYRGNNDNGLLNEKHRSGSRRPVRGESIFAGFDDGNDQDGVREVDNDFSDDEFANAAPIRKTLSKVQNSWKLVPKLKDSVLDRLESASETETPDIGDTSKTEDSTGKVAAKTTSKTFQTKPIESRSRGLSTTKQAENRRKTLVSNGIVGHAQRSKSPSAPGIPGKETATIAPPFPVPTRSSSRNIPLSASDGAASPSPYTTSFFTARRGQGQGRPPVKKKALRKVQSAAAVPKFPEPGQPQPVVSMSASSTAPGSPISPGIPRNQFILPYDSVTEVPMQASEASLPRSHAGEASIETPTQQTSVVDAIAQTMVGEWMWKYVRKRTSFGITETPQAEFEMGRNGDNGNSSGVRHKRWVWLAPYDRAVIWSSKQPTSGPALMGKGGRKLVIQSVLDVKDDTPLPRNASLQSVFDRSILILTPERALKFTAVSRERHSIWLTALSFLTHSTQAMDDLASLPPLPRQEYHRPPSREAATNFRRTPIRDSIRVAKAKSRPSMGPHSFSSPTGGIEQDTIHGSRMAREDNEPVSEDAAEPPQVPRVSAHARKRSITGPRPVPLSAFHSYPGNSVAIASSLSLQAPTSRDKYDRYTPHSRDGSSGPNTTQNTTSGRATASTISQPSIVPDNFFDTVGTMRMEAFVDRKENECDDPTKGKKTSSSYRTRQGRKKDMSYWGVAESAPSSALGSPRLRGDDPFMGF